MFHRRWREKLGCYSKCAAKKTQVEEILVPQGIML